MTPEQLAHHTLSRLQWTLVRAYEEVHHYRQVFDAAGLDPHQFESVDELSSYPFLTDAELTDVPLSLVAVPTTAILRVIDDGAYTTGLTYQDVHNHADLVARSLFAAGIRSGHRVIVALSGEDATVVQEGAESLGCTVLRTHREAPWFDADFRIGPDDVELTSVPALGGPGIGATTEGGIHVWEDHFHPEIVDGELVVTTIMRQAMPLVRYRTGLFGTLEPGTTYPQFRRFLEH